MRQKDAAEEWKCQPNRWLSHPNEMHEIVVGTLNMTMASTFSSLLICWINNGHHNTLYHEFDRYGYTYFFANFLMHFMWLETLAYHLHKLLHTPFFYKHVHKLHHRWVDRYNGFLMQSEEISTVRCKAPTAYSAVAMMPLELTCFQIIILSPCVCWPYHSFPFSCMHSTTEWSITRVSCWKPFFPWQPHTIFHDDHHK